MGAGRRSSSRTGQNWGCHAQARPACAPSDLQMVSKKSVPDSPSAASSYDCLATLRLLSYWLERIWLSTLIAHYFDPLAIPRTVAPLAPNRYLSPCTTSQYLGIMFSSERRMPFKFHGFHSEEFLFSRGDIRWDLRLAIGTHPIIRHPSKIGHVRHTNPTGLRHKRTPHPRSTNHTRSVATLLTVELLFACLLLL